MSLIRPYPPRHSSGPLSDTFCTTPHKDPVASLDHPLCSPPLAQRPVPQPLGLVDGNQGVEDVVVAAADAGHGQHQQVSLLGLLVLGRVLEGVLPALGELLLAAPDPVGVGDLGAGAWVADGVEGDIGGAAEDGAGLQVAFLLPLHYLPVPVDQGEVVPVRLAGPSRPRAPYSQLPGCLRPSQLTIRQDYP